MKDMSIIALAIAFSYALSSSVETLQLLGWR